MTRRVSVLRKYSWSWRRVDPGLEPAPGWLNLERLLGDGGRGEVRERRAALVAYTEAPIRQGRLDNPWEGWVGRVVLGGTREAEGLIRKASTDPDKAWRVAVAAARRARPEWQEILSVPESIRGRWGKWPGRCRA